MKREFPAIYEAVSVWVATPLLGFSTLVYAMSAITNPASEVYPTGVAAFGVTAALSGICFTMTPTGGGSSVLRYSGEKFLHSSLLIVQSLLVIYIRDAVTGFQWVHAHTTFAGNVAGLAAAVLSFVVAAAAWTWHHGFADLNALLWKNWERRIREINDAARENERK